jgi:hypothetical protein
MAIAHHRRDKIFICCLSLFLRRRRNLAGSHGPQRRFTYLWLVAAALEFLPPSAHR